MKRGLEHKLKFVKGKFKKKGEICDSDIELLTLLFFLEH